MRPGYLVWKKSQIKGEKNAPFYGDPEQRHVDMLTTVVILISNWGFRFYWTSCKRNSIRYFGGSQAQTIQWPGNISTTTSPYKFVISSYNSVFGNNLFCIYLTMAFLLGAEAIGVSLCGVCLLGILQRGHVGTVSDMVSRYLRGWVEVEGWWATAGVR